MNPEDRGQIGGSANRHGTQGLAADMRYYGRIICERAQAKIGHLYPKVRLPKDHGGGEVTAIAWLWTRTIQCSNPACGARAPLIRSFWLVRKKPRFLIAKPKIDHVAKTVSFEIENGDKPEKETTSGKGARCLFCGTFFSKGEVRELAVKYGVDEIPFAVVADGPRGRIYLPSTASQVPTISAPDVPDVDQPMTNDRRWFSPPLYGMPNFKDLFTPRQLTAMVTFSDLAKDIGIDVERDASIAGLSPDEAAAYARTVSTFLALAVDRCADFNNCLCRWSASNEKVMNLFGRQAIPMVWDFSEANILGDSVGAWNTCSEHVAHCVEVLTTTTNGGCALQIDAATGANGITNLLVSTDPPYYDNIGYAVLSDFFYVWLRRTVGVFCRDLFSTLLVPKLHELTASPERFDGDKEKAKEHFESGFRKAFSTLREKMDPRFPLSVYYAFKQDDEESDSAEDDGKSFVDLTTGWETLLEALISSGFQITATWPVRASQKWRMVSMGTNALASYIVLACRPRAADAPLATRREFINALKSDLPIALKNLQRGNIAPVDLAQAAIGPGMAVFSRYAKVVEADGSPMTVRTALALINQTLDEVLAEQESEFDADTRWALAWFEQFAFSEGPYGVAETLSKAKNTSVQGMVDSGILSAKAGKVRLLGRKDLAEDWDPAAERRLTIWEVAHYLIRVLEEEGESAAALLFRQVGALGESARDLAYRLFGICERKKWAQEALPYNSLVVAWPEITRLSRSERPRGEQIPLR
jgi:putative DNA methylase